MDTHSLAPARADTEAAPAARTYGAWNALGFQTLVRREIMRFMKVSAQTVVAPLMSTVLFLMVFGFAFADRTWSDTGLPYADGLAPGLIMMAILSNAFQNSSSSMVIAKVQGNAVDFLMPPLSALELMIAFITGAAARGLLVGLASLAAAIPFADVTPAQPLAALYFSVCAAIIFGAIGLIGGIWADKFDHLAAVSNFVITPLTFLSGTFYSVDALPAPWADLLHWNPVYLLIDGFRFGFMGVAHSSLLAGVIVCGGLAAGLCYLAWRLLKSGFGLKA